MRTQRWQIMLSGKAIIFKQEDYNAKFTLNCKMTNNVEDKKHNILELNLKQDEYYNVEAKGAKLQVGVMMSQLKSTNLQRTKMRRQYQHLAQLCQMQFFTTLIKSKKRMIPKLDKFGLHDDKEGMSKYIYHEI